MRKTRKIVSAMLAATMVTGMTMGTTEAFARSSKRAAWNDASSSKDTTTAVKDACFVEDGSETEEKQVYSNVYADSTAWAEWKEKWDTIRNNYEQVALTPGKNATELNFAWYSYTQETPVIKLMDNNGNTIKEFKGTQDVSKAETITDNGITVSLYPSKVTATGLTENTAYKYSYYIDGQWSKAYDYTTKSTDTFSVLYVGDPQIGASVGQDSENAEYHAMNDAYNWNNTMANAYSVHSNVAFMLSAGDQINQTKVDSESAKLEQQIEYAGFLSSPVLRSLPFATTIGNHDSKSQNYSNHYNNPNSATTADNTAGATTAGTDYYFTYGNTLFVVIDTNNYNCATHENVIKEATSANPNAVWKVLMFHQDIYGSGYDHSDSDGIALRTQLTPIINNYGFDAVLQGHDHTYSRTYQLSSTGTEENETCYNILSNEKNINQVINPKGTVYFEANSATGSKYYQLIGTQQNYIAARSQSWRPTYSVIDVTETTLTVKTYDAATNAELVADGDIATSYTIVKEVNKEALNNVITKAESALAEASASDQYTSSSVKALTDTISAAKEIANDAASDSTAVASAVVSVNEAVASLTKKEDKSELTETVKESETTTEQVEVSESKSELNNNNGEENRNKNNTVSNDSNSNSNASNNNASTGNVKTGDSTTPVIFWFALGACSLVSLGAIVIDEIKKKKIREVK